MQFHNNLLLEKNKSNFFTSLSSVEKKKHIYQTRLEKLFSLLQILEKSSKARLFTKKQDLNYTDERIEVQGTLDALSRISCQ